VHSRILHLALVLGVPSILAVACTSADTSLVAPTASKCQLTLASTPVSFGPSGGTGSMNITTTRDCTWSITTIPAWISIAGQQSGQGEGVVSYAVASNPVPAPRSGSIAVGTESVQISQAAAPCQFELNKGGDSVSAAGGHLAVQVTTLTGCNWSAKSDVPWVVISSGPAGNGNGTVGLEVAANSGTARVATLTIAGLTFTVQQSGAAGQAPGAPPAPPSQTSVQVDGRAKNIKGHCPNLSFTVSGRGVETSKDTVFVGLSCRDLEKRELDVHVVGLAVLNGTIDATVVRELGDGNGQ
jgi:hypothetical protein